MPCAKCKSDFNVFNWKTKCNECLTYYCSKCLKKQERLVNGCVNSTSNNKFLVKLIKYFVKELC